MKTKIKPLGNRIVVRRTQAGTSKGGILLPDTAKEKPREGEVLAVGPGKRNDDGVIEPMTLKVGQKVLFSSYGGTEIKSDDEELLVLAEDDVLGMLVE